MSRGVLKNIIGALCVGALISMPVIVSAAEKEDIAGTWTYNKWNGTVEFKSDGMAEDAWGDDGTADQQY